MLLDSLVAPLTSFLGAPGLAPAPIPQFHGLGEVRTALYFGQRLLSDDFEPAEEQLVLGISIDVREPGSTSSFEVGYFLSSGDGREPIGANTIDVDSRVHEIWMGGRWTFDPWSGSLKPYVGVGLSVLHGEYETKGVGESDSNDGWAVGAFAHGGIEWEFADRWAIGLDLRGLLSTPATLQEEVPFDYLQAGVTLSWVW